MSQQVRDQCLCRTDLRMARAITIELGTSIIVQLPSLGTTTMCSSRRITGLLRRPMGLRTAAVLLLLRRETFSSGQPTLLRRPITARRRARRPIAALLKVRRRIVLRLRRTTGAQSRAGRHLLRSTRCRLLARLQLRMRSRTGAVEAITATESLFRDNSHTRTTMGRDHCVIAMVTALCYGRTRGLI